MAQQNYSQICIQQNFRSLSKIGLFFSALPKMKTVPIFNFHIVANQSSWKTITLLPLILSII